MVIKRRTCFSRDIMLVMWWSIDGHVFTVTRCVGYMVIQRTRAYQEPLCRLYDDRKTDILWLHRNRLLVTWWSTGLVPAKRHDVVDIVMKRRTYVYQRDIMFVTWWSKDGDVFIKRLYFGYLCSTDGYVLPSGIKVAHCDPKTEMCLPRDIMLVTWSSKRRTCVFIKRH